MEKNRYQKALEELRTLYKDNKLEEETFEDFEELVEKATLMKITRTTESGSYDCDDHGCGFEYEIVYCPHCGKELVNESEELDWNDIEYCLYCGQHLDWEDENE